MAKGPKASLARGPAPFDLRELDVSERVHGGLQPADGLDRASVVDFSANVNPYGPCPAVLEALRTAPLEFYPDPQARAARKAWAQALDTEPERLAVGHGAADLFWAVARALVAPGDRVVIAEPTFSELRVAARVAGARLVQVWSEPGQLQVSLEALLASAQGARLLYLCSPNNPTGECLPARALAQLARDLGDTLLVLDQSFLSLSDRADERSFSFPDNVICVRSLTKDFALPGLRIGLLWAARELVQRVEACRPSWSTSAPALAAIEAAARQASFVADSYRRMAMDRERIAQGLRTEGFAPLPSQSVFQLMPIPDAGELRSALLEQGVLVRDCSSFGLAGHVRIAARPAADAEKLLAALRGLRARAAVPACPPGALDRPAAMAFHSTRECVEALERVGQLIKIDQEVDPNLEAAEIQRRVYQAGGPALLFTRVKGSRFPMASNLFGSLERAEFLFADALEPVRRVVELKVDPGNALRRPFRYLGVPFTALSMLPRRVGTGPVLAQTCSIRDLPQLKSWPDDGGAFITLPQVFTEDPDHPGPMKSNLGMYRVQLGGNAYEPDREIGLHYQIHRGIGVHHQAAIRRGEPLRVSVFVGGPPAMTVAAVMPLPEGLSELAFAGALARRRVRLAKVQGHTVHADADFCIVGTVEPGQTKPEGPFGDHLGYYSLTHDFPVLRVEQVYARSDAIWPFTVVGRPPQEDTVFGLLIRELTGPVVPTALPGVRAVHAVDASGVHPLLLALGSERYVPYRARKEPQELLTQANAILGFGQMSLAKVVLIAATEDAPELDLHDIPRFLAHVLARADFRRDLHFQTRTTIDTLDYSGQGFNQGSKLVLAAVGEPVRELAASLPAELSLPSGFGAPHFCLPGVLALRGPAYSAEDATGQGAVRRLCKELEGQTARLAGVAWIVVVDDSEFAAHSLNNFLWATFTRMNPAVDIDGVGAFTEHKHWGCTGPLVIDARRKPHHAPPLIEDPEVTRRVDELGKRGGPLHGIL